ncbi:MAG: hypothetical protein CMH56_08440 [Myxococcales bacterium]|nr:hypothetical protein [Myxococcales bacterium]
MNATSLAPIREALKRGNAKEAHLMLQTADDGMAQSPEFLLLKAEIHWELVQPQEAIGALKLAIQKNPRHAGAYALLGKYLLNKGLPEQALNFLDRAITLDPGLAEAKRIRNRAERQKQKKYASLSSHAAAQLEGPGKKSNQSNERKEVTRQFMLNPSGGLEKVEENLKTTDAALDEAFKLLLGAESVGAKSEFNDANQAGVSRMVSLIIAMGFLLFLGTSFGVGGFFILETISIQTAEQSLFAELEKDNAPNLANVLRQAQLLLAQETEKESEVLAAQALAHYLLWRDHLDGLNHLERSAELIDSLDNTGLASPYGILVRAYFKADRSIEVSSLASLDEDLRDALKAPSPHPYLYLAAALLEDNSDDKIRYLQRGIIIPTLSNPRLRYVLAQVLYPTQASKSKALLEENLQHHPNHIPSRLASMAMAYQEKNQSFSPLEEGIPPVVHRTNELFTLVLQNQNISQYKDGDGLHSDASTVIFDAYTKLFNLQYDKASKAIDLALELLPDHPHLMALRSRTLLASSLPPLGQAFLTDYPQFTTDHVFLYGPIGTLQIAPFQPGFPFRFSFDKSLFPESLLSYMTRRDKAGEKGLYRTLQITEKQQAIHNALLFSDIEKAIMMYEDMRDAHEDRPETHLAHFALALAQSDNDKIDRALKSVLLKMRGEPEAYLQAANLLLAYGYTEKSARVIKTFTDQGFVSPKTDRLYARMAVRKPKGKNTWQLNLNPVQKAKQEILLSQKEGNRGAVSQQSRALESRQALLTPSFMLTNPHYGWTSLFFQMENTPKLGTWVRKLASLNGKWKQSARYNLLLGSALEANGETEAAKKAYEAAKRESGRNLWVKTEAKMGLENL